MKLEQIKRRLEGYSNKINTKDFFQKLDKSLENANMTYDNIITFLIYYRPDRNVFEFSLLTKPNSNIWITCNIIDK